MRRRGVIEWGMKKVPETSFGSKGKKWFQGSRLFPIHDHVCCCCREREGQMMRIDFYLFRSLSLILTLGFERWWNGPSFTHSPSLFPLFCLCRLHTGIVREKWANACEMVKQSLVRHSLFESLLLFIKVHSFDLLLFASFDSWCLMIDLNNSLGVHIKKIQERNRDSLPKTDEKRWEGEGEATQSSYSQVIPSCHCLILSLLLLFLAEFSFWLIPNLSILHRTQN